MVQKAANIRFHAVAVPAELTSPPVASWVVASSWMGAWRWGIQVALFVLIAIAPHTAWASCGDYLQHREHWEISASVPSHGESSGSEPSCRSGQCRSRSSVPMLPSEYLTKWDRMRDLLESTGFGKETVEAFDPFGVFWMDGAIPSSAFLDVPVPPPRGTFS